MKPVIHALAYIGGLLAAMFLLCAGVGWLMGDAPEPINAFAGLSALCFLVSFATWGATRSESAVGRRDALLLVVSAWLITAMIGALPYLVLRVCPDLVSALFESMSGLTTTGASVLSDLETLPRSILFWRSLTHFLGGVGILIMFIAILPFVGAGGVQLFKAEATGLFSEKLTPRIASTARIIMAIYLSLNLLCAIALRLGGLSWFEAVCHAFGTISTGGFSTRTASVAAFNCAYIETVIILFMFVSGCSFVLHYRALRHGINSYSKNSEWRFYGLTCLGASLVVALALRGDPNLDWSLRLRQGAFQAVSVMTSTGFTTADYDRWPTPVKLILMALAIIGASAGSTAGAVKSIRFVVAAKTLKRQFQRLLQPNRIQSLKVDGEVVEPDRIEKALVYILLYLSILLTGAFVLSWMMPDMVTAGSAMIASLGNLGPALGGAGPTLTYAPFPAFAKLVLILCMWLGRLEIFVCIAICLPAFWKAKR